MRGHFGGGLHNLDLCARDENEAGISHLQTSNHSDVRIWTRARILLHGRSLVAPAHASHEFRDHDHSATEANKDFF
ncbi:hypothetical protein TNCV_312731 [Trichonephila clavipes]|nr:hypothetical protein TNCV_312731 [Trichonephila clavipes]